MTKELNEILKFYNNEILKVEKSFLTTCYYLKNKVDLKKLKSLKSEIEFYTNKKANIITKNNKIVLEFTNENRKTILLKNLLKEKTKVHDKLKFVLGLNNSGESVTDNLTEAPHILIAGATGSGKSVVLNNIINSLNYYNNDLKFALIDVKRVEFSKYKSLSNLFDLALSEKEASDTLDKCISIMTARYKLFEEKGYKNIQEYNENEEQKLFYLVLIIDEFADLIIQNEEIEEKVIRLTQLARASGIHLIIATQRPTTNVISGLIKANVPTRISLSVASTLDSKIILDEKGAENLNGKGDLLYKKVGSKELLRIQAPFSN